MTGGVCCFVFLQKELNQEQEEDSMAPFMCRPFCTYKGHDADLLDVSWSKVRVSFDVISQKAVCSSLNCWIHST